MEGIISEAARNLYAKVKAFKHITKVIEETEKKGSLQYKLNNQGISVTLTAGCALYFELKAQQAQLAKEINDYKIAETHTVPSSILGAKRSDIAIPVCSVEAPAKKIAKVKPMVVNPEDVKKTKAERKKETNKKWRSKPEVKAKLAAYAKEYYRRKKAEKAAAVSPVL